MNNEKCPFDKELNECKNCSFAVDGVCSIKPIELERDERKCPYKHKNCECCDFAKNGECGLEPLEY